MWLLDVCPCVHGNHGRRHMVGTQGEMEKKGWNIRAVGEFRGCWVRAVNCQITGDLLIDLLDFTYFVYLLTRSCLLTLHNRPYLPVFIGSYIHTQWALLYYLLGMNYVPVDLLGNTYLLVSYLGYLMYLNNRILLTGSHLLPGGYLLNCLHTGPYLLIPTYWTLLVYLLRWSDLLDSIYLLGLAYLLDLPYLLIWPPLCTYQHYLT